MPGEKTEIKLAKNGPLLIKGACELLDANGQPMEKRETFGLCRCGGSKNKPFCDGTHKTNGFQG